MAQAMEEHADIRNVRSLRPLRVLVAARDARFGRVSGFLLARRGFDVELLHRPSQILEAVSRTGIDVVIVDASDSFSETARSVGALEALHPHLTVVVVAVLAAAVSALLQRVVPQAWSRWVVAAAGAVGWGAFLLYVVTVWRTGVDGPDEVRELGSLFHRAHRAHQTDTSRQSEDPAHPAGCCVWLERGELRHGRLERGNLTEVDEARQ